MRLSKDFKNFLTEIFIGIFIITSLNPIPAIAGNSSDEIIYPLKKISKLECRFTEFDELSSNCKQELPVLKTKDYKKYAVKDGGYNDYTRLYTVLWGSSYKYGWDVGNGGHMGVDIATSKGTPIYAMAEGTVIKAKEQVSLGNSVSIKHKINGKTVVSSYSHMSKIIAKEGDKVKAGTLIGLAGSTGNSTGNHLHFQIDLEGSFYPAYYNYKTCPYSYYEISEKGVCFDQLEKITVDPLLFLETNGKILDNIKTTTVSRDNFDKNDSSNNSSDELAIFNKTVYIGYPESDIKKVQEIFRELGYYDGKITGDYNDVIDDIINYQVKSGVIATETSEGAGRFGPKTRTQVKKDYLSLENKDESDNKNETVENINNNKTEKISRENLITREEIEAREVKDFLKKYNVELKFKNVGGNIETGKTEVLKLTVTDRKGKLFKGNMPSGMTFIVDESKVSVFPQKLYYFTDGKRDIKLTGKKTGNTNLYIKIGNQTIETIPLKVYSKGVSIKPKTGLMLGVSKIVLGEEKTGIIAFKDNNGKSLINVRYDANYKLQTSKDAKICVKSGDISNMKKIFDKKCKASEYKDYQNITYDDTVGGLIIFDYKVSGRDAKIELIDNNGRKSITNKNLAVTNPKGLKSNYEYKDAVVEMLEEGVVDGINKGYFLEERELTEYDSLSWIRNTLIKMNEDSQYFAKKSEIENNLREVFKLRENASHFKTIDREKFLELTYEYLVFDKSNNGITREFKDLENNQNKMASNVFYKDNTWKDKFGENYFRPNVKITRGEGAYLLSNIIDNNKQVFLTLK